MQGDMHLRTLLQHWHILTDLAGTQAGIQVHAAAHHKRMWLHEPTCDGSMPVHPTVHSCPLPHQAAPTDHMTALLTRYAVGASHRRGRQFPSS